MLMENAMQVNCACSLINVNLKQGKPPTITHIHHRQPSPMIHVYQSVRQPKAPSNQKIKKISLSKSISRSGSISGHSNKSQGSLKFQSMNLETISQGFGKNSQISIAPKKSRKKFLEVTQSCTKISGESRFKTEDDWTKNTVKYSPLIQKYQQAYSKEEKNDETVYEQLPKIEERITVGRRQQTRKHLGSKSEILLNIDDDILQRKIITLKQLEYRNAQSAGIVTSEGNMSMVVSFQSQAGDENRFQMLTGMAKKTSHGMFYTRQ